MAGFFKDDEIQDANSGLAKHLGCSQCGLSKITSKTKPTGKGEMKILIVGESPGDGEATEFLRKCLKDVGINLDKDCRKINSILCPPIGKIKDHQIACCRTNVLQEINTFKPDIIVPLGNVAVHSIIGNVWKKDLGGIARWRGWAIPDRTYNCWVMPTYHPQFILKREENNRNKLEEDIASKIFKEDIKKIMGYYNAVCDESIFPGHEWPQDEEESIIILKDIDDIKTSLKRLIKRPPEWLAFDYETTGLKPHRKGHDIVCVSICDGNKTISFPMFQEIRLYFKEMLQNKSKKIASNLKFETQWSRVILDCDVNNWGWDTMLSSHIQDNREEITSIKFQAYIRYGISDYDSEISHYLKAVDEKDANAFNRIHEAPMDKLLLYCGMDSLLEYRVAMDQMKETGIVI